MGGSERGVVDDALALPVKVQQLKNEIESTDSTEFEVTHGRCRAEREAAAVHKTVWKAGLTPEDFAAVRLWSGHTWNTTRCFGGSTLR